MEVIFLLFILMLGCERKLDDRVGESIAGMIYEQMRERDGI